MVDKKIAIAVIILIIAAIGIILADNKSTDVKNIDTQNKVTVKVAGYLGVNGLSTYNPPKIAEELGFFDGIKIDDVDVPIGPESVAAVSSGSVDAAHVPYNVIIRAVAKGAKIKALAAAHGAKSTVNFHMFVPKDSPIKNAKDLKGKKIGGVIPGDTSYIAIEEYLKTGGLTVNDVDLISVPFGQTEQALKSGQVDVSGSWFDFEIAGIKARNETRVLFTIYDTLPKDAHHCGIIFSEKFIRENPEIVKKFIDGFVKANDWTKQNPEKAKELHIKFAKDKGLDTTPIEKYYVANDIRDHALIEDYDVQYYIDWLAKNGEIKEGQIKLSDIYTNEFNPYYKK